MNLLLLGLNHTTAPVAVRERYAVSPAQWTGIDEKAVQSSAVDEAVLISTCNRTELLAVSARRAEARESLYQFIQTEVGDGSARPEHFYEKHDKDVLEHVFRVACGLDSMVLGEAQILGQVKAAYRAAAVGRSCGPLLSRLFQRAFRAAKRVRTETGIGATSISVARVGVQLAREIFETFENKRVILVGAGEMAESALRGLRDEGVSAVVVINRTLETAARLAAGIGGRAAPLADLERELSTADIVLTSVQVDRPLLARPHLERCMRDRQGSPLLLIDLGIPRNIDPAANSVEGVYVYDIDDLDEVAARGRLERISSVQPAEAIVRDEIDRFLRWQAGLRAVPAIRQLLAHANAIAESEVRRTATRLGEADPESVEALKRMADAILAKLLHHPLECLRGEAEEDSGPYYSDAVHEIFGLREADE